MHCALSNNISFNSGKFITLLEINFVEEFVKVFLNQSQLFSKQILNILVAKILKWDILK